MIDPETASKLKALLAKHGACCLALFIAIAITTSGCGRDGGGFSLSGEYSRTKKEVREDLPSKTPPDVQLPVK